MSLRIVTQQRSALSSTSCRQCQATAARLRPDRARSRRVSSTAAGVQVEQDEPLAGPSPQARTTPQYSAPAGSSRLQASKARSILASLSPGHLSSLRTLQAALRPKKSRTEFTRLEIHAVAHHLVRTERKALAASFIASRLEGGELKGHRRRTGALHRATLLRIVEEPRSGRSPRETHHLRFNSRVKDTNPFEHSALQPLQPSTLLAAQMLLLQSLLKVRHPRPPEFYTSIINQCISERLPDLAATVYVGLVEEWITEGRVAEGASLADFHEGGGPARGVVDAPRFPSPTTQERNRWFQGVRTWKLPGETLSPHDRLDLWHPHKLALPDKMRNFPLPLPTSPPSLVPEPSSRMLNLILKALRLDTQDPTTSPSHFAASARALAILANTVHNRTLPIGALPALLVAFRALPYQPMIFPASFPSAPEKEAYAFSASSHAHGALLSLLLSPPSYPQHIRIQSRSFTSALSEMFAQSKASYVFPPLSIKSCNVLLQYALSKLKRPAVLTNLLVYMKEAFGGVLPAMSLNILYRNGTLLRRNDIAEPAEEALFKDIQLREADGKDRRQSKLGGEVQQQHPKQPVHYVAPSSPPLPNAAAAQRALGTTEGTFASDKPSERSLVALIAHLTATSQFDRLKSLTQTLVPRTRGDWREEKGWTPLTPYVYGALVNGLCKAGATGLARTVYIDAKEAESASWRGLREALQQEPSRISQADLGWFVPIHVYTSMLQMMPQITQQHVKDASGSTAGVDSALHSKAAERSRRTALHVHKDMCGAAKWAADVGEKVGPQVILSPPQPDVRYFNAHVRACENAWRLRGDAATPMTGAAREHLVGIVADMEATGVAVPPALQELADTGERSGYYTRNKAVKTRGWDVTRHWAARSRPATEDEQRRIEEVENDWVKAVEQGQIGKE